MIMVGKLKKIIISFLKTTFYRLKYDIYIGSNVIIGGHSYFEGKNVLNDNVFLWNVVMGTGTYIANNTMLKMTKIGRFCAIGENVRTCLGMHPTKDFISIHPSFFSIKKQAGFTFVNRDKFEEHKYTDRNKQYVVEVGNDVWIGNNVTIMDGIIIGDGAIIAAGTIITKNVPAYAIVAGVPGKITKYRFDEETIAALLKIKWWNYSIKDLKKIAESFASKDEFFNKIKNII